MANIDIIHSSIRFKSTEIGRPTRASKEHYNGRRITALVDGEERLFRFNKDELSFGVDEEDMEQAIKDRLNTESKDAF